MIFIQAVPKDDYFVWQLAVQATNFRKFGVSDRMEVVVWYPSWFTDWSKWKKLEKAFPEVKFFYYEDEGVNLGLYIPQLRPHSLKKYFRDEAERLKGEVFFYHDADIIFNRLPDFKSLGEGPICWQSDCSGYLDYSYIVRKEDEGKIPNHEALNLFATLGGITPETIQSYDGNTGGAQSILKGINAEFWQAVESITMQIRTSFFYDVEGSINRRYFPHEAAGYQSWACDMWGLNFALWQRGIPTSTTDELDFSWATDSLETFHRKPIFHNAGALPKSGLFYKGSWIDKWPLDNPEVKFPPENTASNEYVKAIKETNNILS